MKELSDGCVTAIVGIVGLLVILALIFVPCFALWSFGLWPEYVPINPMDIYETSYNACIARETLSDAQCHDIALKEAYPDE